MPIQLDEKQMKQIELKFEPEVQVYENIELKEEIKKMQTMHATINIAKQQTATKEDVLVESIESEESYTSLGKEPEASFEPLKPAQKHTSRKRE